MSPALSRVIDDIRRADLPQFGDTSLDSVNVQGGAFGETMLHVVAIWGDVDAARVLIDEGAVIDVPGEYGCTPLHEATMRGYASVVTLLLSRGADPSLRCEFGDFFEIAARSDSVAIQRITDDTKRRTSRSTE